jgi:hypothetical protein
VCGESLALRPLAGALAPEHDDTNSLRHGWFVLGGGSR